jgi:hypothetical protein
VWLPVAQKIAYANSINPKNVNGSVVAIDRYCAIKLHGTQPAGQADMSFAPEEGLPSVTVQPDGSVVDSTGANLGLASAFQETPKQQGTVGVGGIFTPGIDTSQAFGKAPTPVTPSAPLLTPQQQTALFGAVGNLLSTTGTAISAAIQGNNQLELARLQSQTQTEIARLTTQSQQSMNAGNLTLAQQQSQAAAQLQMFQNLLASQSQNNTVWYVAAGIAAVLVIGAAIYFAPSRGAASSSETTPRRSTRSSSASRITVPRSSTSSRG